MAYSNIVLVSALAEAIPPSCPPSWRMTAVKETIRSWEGPEGGGCWDCNLWHLSNGALCVALASDVERKVNVVTASQFALSLRLIAR